MKKIILVCLLVLVLLVGCGQKVVCDKPYILVGSECCLDNDDNGICDRDEVKEEPKIEAQEEPLKQEEIKETHETTPLEEYTLSDLQANLNEVIWAKNKIWSSMDNLSNDTVSFLKYGFDDLIIAESHNLDEYSYDNFLNEIFFTLIKDKEVEPANFISSDNYFRDIHLSSLDVKDKRVYWIYQNNIITAHSLNFKCSPTLFVGVIPDYFAESTSATDDKVDAINTGFDTSTRNIISDVYKVSINCPLANKYPNKIYELQQSINNELGVDYSFEVKKIQDILSHISIDDDNSIKVYDEITRKYHPQTYKYKKMVIDELGNTITSIEDLKEISQIHSSEDTETISDNEENFKNSFKKPKSNEKMEVSLLDEIGFDEVNEIDPKTIEVLNGKFQEYEVIYTRTDTEDNRKENHVGLNVVHKLVFKCKGNITISVYSNSIDYIYNQYVQRNIDNAFKSSRNNLLKDLEGLKEACESI